MTARSSTEVSPAKKRVLTLFGRAMAYVEVGQGDPVVFLHGNPTSSYVWRNIVPHLQHQARCIAPDLISEPRIQNLMKLWSAV